MKAKSRPGAGRPTREQAEQRHAQMLEQALDLFLAQGYERTTIEQLAASVGMTKRTIYARYADKEELFRAAIARATKDYATGLGALEELEQDDLEATLVALARLRLSNLATERGLRLQRLLNAEGYRFPDVMQAFYDEAVKPTVSFLAELLRRRAEAGEVVGQDAEEAARAFMNMVVGGQARGILAGTSAGTDNLDERIAFAVRLFLNGVRPRS